MRRRTFVQSVAVASAGLASEPLWGLERTGGGELPIVDTHQHLWNRSQLRIPWLEKAPPILNRDYTTRDYDEAVKGLNVRQAVYLEVGVADTDKVKEATSIEKLAEDRSNRTTAAVIGGRCDLPEFAGYIEAFAESRVIKGVRHIVAGKPQGFCLQEPFLRSVRLLGKLGMSFDLTITPALLDDANRLCRKCPDTLFVVDHCGGADPQAFVAGRRARRAHDPEQWKRGMARLAELDNTVCKISGIVARVPKHWKSEDLAPIVNHCFDVFGADRVMFGGDWPVCLRGATLREWVTALKEIVSDRPPSHQRKLFAENAVRHYRL